jgi:CMP-N,N'-diacetyllegionaminic acid synthase
MKILAYIPARSGSKGVPDKNILQVENIPLLSFSMFTAMDCMKEELFADVLLSTDSARYLDIASGEGYSDHYLRPAQLAQDDSPTIDGVHHALEYLSDQGKEYDAVMILQPTAPFRTKVHIIEAIELMQKNPGATCVTGLKLLGDYHPARIQRIDNDIWLKPFCRDVVEGEPSRRQDFSPPAYLRNGTIYLTPIEIIKKGYIRGSNPIGFVMPEENSINVDDHIDFVLAKSVLQYEKYSDQLKYFEPLRNRYKNG